jgi:hypothetical protein
VLKQSANHQRLIDTRLSICIPARARRRRALIAMIRNHGDDRPAESLRVGLQTLRLAKALVA